MSKAARIRYTADGNYVDKQAKEFTLTAEIIEKLDSIEPSAERNAIQGIKVNGQIQTPDQYRVVSLAIPEVEDNLDSISSTNALSAKQGRFLYNRIKNLEGLGKFLSNWDSTTGMPTTNPQAIPYEYHSGDYYIVGRIGATNYRPDGTSYRGIPSTVVESEEVKVGDFYFFNGSIWELLLNTDRQIPIDESLSTTSTNPVENRVVTAALNLKANDADISVVGKTNDYNDLDNIPNIPDSLDDLTGTSDDITEGNSHLFLTSAERTKLANTTGVNTGDETNASIMSKLGAASSTTNGYLTVADWNTFNNKQGAISDLETIRSNASAGKNASDTIATYGDIVTHDANEFATASQGGKADTAIQPGDNVSELTNDAGYITSASLPTVNNGTLTVKQNGTSKGTFTANQSGASTIELTDTIYSAGNGIDITNNAISTASIYGTSSTAAATTEKVVSIPSITSLNVGQVIIVKPTTTSTVANSTIKLNSFDAYPMRYNNAAITTSTDSVVWAANIPSMFMFDGTYWQFLGHGLDSNTTYSVMSVAEGTTGTATSARTVRADYLKQIIEHYVSEAGGNVIAVTQAEYDALTPSEKADGKLRIISDAPTIEVGNVFSTSVSNLVVSSSAPASGTPDSVITFVI